MDLPTEEWRPTYLCEKYEVSNYGRIRRNGRILKFSYNGHGYASVTIHMGKVRKQSPVHRLVIFAFVPQPSPGLHCRHIDGNHQNNVAWNLEWGTIRDNAKDRIRHGTQPRGEQHGQSKLTDAIVVEIRSRYASGDTFAAIAREYGVTHTIAMMACTGRTWSHLPGAVPSRTAHRLDRYLQSRLAK